MDLIIYNGKVTAMGGGSKDVTALAVKDGLIAAIGDDNEMLALRNSKTRVVDAGGRRVIPGLNDSHLHLINYAISKSGVDLNGCRSAAEAAARIKSHIITKAIPPGGLVTARGWNQELFENKTFVTRHDLDQASENHLIYAVRACGHVAAANSLLLARSGINASTSPPEGGEIYRGADGTPNGVFSENALDLINPHKQPLNKNGLRELIQSVLPELAALGITSVQSDDFTDLTPPTDVIAAYTELAAEGRLTARVNQQRRGYKADDCLDIMAMAYDKSVRDYYKPGPIKLFADGSLGARTAYLTEDYYDDPGNKGVAIYTQIELQAVVNAVHNAGESLAVHAIGDGAADMALNCFESAQTKYPGKHVRHGVVHAQITTTGQLRRFAALGVMAYIQPIFIHADSYIVNDRVGKEKASASYAFKTLRDLGVVTPMGTDCPVEPFDPFNNIYCAVTRKGLTGYPPVGFIPSQALTVMEALSSYTADGAYASFEENKKGRLLPGYMADIAILSRDICETPPEEIMGTSAVMTVVGGVVVHDMM